MGATADKKDVRRIDYLRDDHDNVPARLTCGQTARLSRWLAMPSGVLARCVQCQHGDSGIRVH
jgi:hypothetical protein